MTFIYPGNHVQSYRRYNIGRSVRNSRMCDHMSHAHARRAYCALHGAMPRTINTWFASRWNSRARGRRAFSLIESSNRAAIVGPGDLRAVTAATACTHGCMDKLAVDANAYANNTRLAGYEIGTFHAAPAETEWDADDVRVYPYRYPCNYGFIENDASPRHISPLWRIPSPSCSWGRSSPRWQDLWGKRARSRGYFNASWLLKCRNYYPVRAVDHWNSLRRL